VTVRAKAGKCWEQAVATLPAASVVNSSSYRLFAVYVGRVLKRQAERSSRRALNCACSDALVMEHFRQSTAFYSRLLSPDISGSLDEARSSLSRGQLEQAAPCSPTLRS